MYRWIGGAVVGMVVLAALVSGCGSDSEAAGLTKAEYVKQANKICAERRDEWKTTFSDYEKEAKEKDAVGNEKVEKELATKALEETLLPTLEQQLESFEDLGLPEGKEKQAEKMVKTLAKSIESIEKPSDLLEASFYDFEKEATALGVNCSLF